MSFFGNYRGEVLRTDDPLKSGRIKIRVFGVYDELDENQIPWAIYADPMMGGGMGVGSLVVPEVGAHVWVFFEAGDHHQPVYWSGAPAMSEDGARPDVPIESQAEGSVYPHNKVLKTAAGILLELDDSEDNVRIHVKHPTGTETLVDNEGNVVENTVATRTTTVSGDISVSSEGTITVTAGGSTVTIVDGSVSVDTNGEVSISAGGGVTVDAGGDLTVNGGGNVTVSGGGNVAVSGAMVSLN